ncbi:MAG: L,D-transpeptidase family protein [Gemmatimonas sp.]|nr:L,D-transpeptidase family protein [Gemmatimonas sp.]
MTQLRLFQARPVVALVRGAIGVVTIATFAVSPASGQKDDLAFINGSGSDQSATYDGPTALERGHYAVVIDLDENRLYFKQGDLTLWSAPVGTGTGMRVITNDNDWEFSTPTGQFQVQYKERDPIWIAPDWYYIENDLPVPPANDPSRHREGVLGVAAVYISPSLAIHGTDKPELIGERVSHGCIRLENRYAMRLYHNVQIGTEVIIVGGEQVKKNARVVDLRKGYDPSLASKGGRKKASVDKVYQRWIEMDTDELADVLEEELEEDVDDSRWDEVALILVDRAQNENDEALDVLFERSLDLPTRAIEREWGTLLADVYRRAPEWTLEMLSGRTPRERRRLAGMMVEASVTLYGGDLESRSTPWPTSRLSREAVGRRAGRGWDLLAEAERRHRTRTGTARTRD